MHEIVQFNSGKRLQISSKDYKLDKVVDCLIEVAYSLFQSLESGEMFSFYKEHGHVNVVISTAVGVCESVASGYDRNIKDVIDYVFEVRKHIAYIDRCVCTVNTERAMVEINIAVNILCNKI